MNSNRVLSEEIIRLRQAIADFTEVISAARSEEDINISRLAQLFLRACLPALNCTGGFVAVRQISEWNVLYAEDISEEEIKLYKVSEIVGNNVFDQTMSNSGKVNKYTTRKKDSQKPTPSTKVIPIKELITFAFPRDEPEIMIAVFDKKSGGAFHESDLRYVKAIGEFCAIALERSRLKDKVWLGTQISAFFPQRLIDQIERTGKDLQIGKFENINPAVVFFSDLSNFSLRTRELGNEEMAKLIHEFREKATEIIFDHGGIIDNFIGDAILAVFGKFEWHNQYPLRAVESAIQILEIVDRLNVDNMYEMIEPLGIRIGIHMGSCSSGIFGGKMLQHTVIGHMVNVASRIESQKEHPPGEIWISADLWQALNELQVRTIQFEQCPTIKAKNIEEPIVVYRVKT